MVETNHKLIRTWQAQGWIDAMDYALATMLEKQVPASAPVIPLVALLSRYLRGGHICLELENVIHNLPFTPVVTPEVEKEEGEEGRNDEEKENENSVEADVASLETLTPRDWWLSRSLDQWRTILHDNVIVTTDPHQQVQPLVFVDDLLYFYRLWQAESSVAQALASRLYAEDVTPDLRAPIHALFPETGAKPSSEVNWQKVACAMAACGPLTIITGGPGTGKTTTVVRLLALLQQQSLQAHQSVLSIALAAPTGKAAARLSESIAYQIQGLNVPEDVRASIPSEVRTLHRLLGSRPQTRAFKRNKDNPLAYDIVVVDEASMIDLDMMDSLMQALTPQTRLILLGDKDQLASVEAGAVLGELCEYADQVLYSDKTVEQLRELTDETGLVAHAQGGTHPLEQRVVKLQHSHRFAADSGIGRLASAMNEMRVHDALSLLDAPPADVHWLDGTESESETQAAIDALIRQGYQSFVQVLKRPTDADQAHSPAFEDWGHALLKSFDAFRLLCAVREGPQGVVELNQRTEVLLNRTLQKEPEQTWYHGRPVMVVRNDYALQLMNGDIGITVSVRLPDGRKTLRVIFPDSGQASGLRLISPSRLTAVETVFAMTVHKSQGSEFTHCALVMPETPNPVLTKELLYTGVTRAREQLTLVGSREIVVQTIRQRVQRHSGLRIRLAQAYAEQGELGTSN